MHDPSGTCQKLIEENALLKKRIQVLESSEAERMRAEEVKSKADARFRQVQQMESVRRLGRGTPS